MKKKTDDELGILLTREMKTMMFDENLTAEQKVQIFCAVVGDEKVDNPLLNSFANSLKVGYVHANSARMSSIYKRRDRQRKTYEDERTSTEIGVDSHSSPIKGKGKGNNNPPTPKGVGRIPSPVSPEEIMSGHGGRRGDSTKNGRKPDGRCVWCDGDGFCRDPENNCQGSHCCNCMGKISAEDWADKFAAEIVEWYPYKVNPVGLTKTLLTEAKKTSARAIAVGIAAWRRSGAWDEERFIPRKIMAWIRGGCYGEKPPQKNTAARGDGARVQTAPSSDATMRMIESGDEEE